MLKNTKFPSVDNLSCFNKERVNNVTAPSRSKGQPIETEQWGIGASIGAVICSITGYFRASLASLTQFATATLARRVVRLPQQSGTDQRVKAN